VLILQFDSNLFILILKVFSTNFKILSKKAKVFWKITDIISISLERHTQTKL